MFHLLAIRNHSRRQIGRMKKMLSEEVRPRYCSLSVVLGILIFLGMPNCIANAQQSSTSPSANSSATDSTQDQIDTAVPSLSADRILSIFRDTPEALQSVVQQIGRTSGAPQMTEDDVIQQVRTDPRFRAQVTALLIRKGFVDANDPDLANSKQRTIDQDSDSELSSNQASDYDRMQQLPADDQEMEDALIRQQAASSGAQTPSSAVSRRPIAQRPEVSKEKPVDNEPVTRRRPSPYNNIPALRDLYSQTVVSDVPLKIFGSDVFADNSRLRTTTDVPAGPDYVLGSGDGLSLSLSGSISRKINLLVDREGRVTLPEIGNLLVAGKTLGEVRELIQREAATEFHNVRTDVSLTRVRNVRVYVVGDVRHPGAYDISALSTIVNAMAAAGGPTAKGSLRHIEHYRGKALVADLDVYDLLLKGNRGEVASISDGDTILVRPVGPQVKVSGAVRRPAIYELKDETTLGQVANLAGGFLVSASLRDLKIERVQAHQSRLMIPVSLPLQGGQAAIDASLNSFKVQDGDSIVVNSIPAYSNASVYLDGHVVSPGKYSYREGMRLTDIVHSFNDLLPEPSDRAEIVRLAPPDFSPRITDFNLRSALSGDDSLVLQPFDTIRIFGRYQYDPPMVAIYGDVLRPGSYPMSNDMSAVDLVRLAGGLARSALKDFADLASYDVEEGKKVKTDQRRIRIGDALAGTPDTDVRLKPGDVLTIHQLAGWNDIGASINVSGAVSHPGTYGIEDGERLSKVLLLAGGFRPDAYPRGAILMRKQVREMEENAKQTLLARLEGGAVTPKVAPGPDAEKYAASFHQQQQDMVRRLRSQPTIGRQIIQISGNITEWQNTASDIEVRDGDVLFIPKIPTFVAVQGQVNNPTAITYVKGKSASWYLKQSGGVSQYANQKGSFIVRANGSVVGKNSGSSLWGSSVMNTVMLPGDTLVIPEKVISPNSTWRYIVESAQVLSSIAIAASVVLNNF